jgi:transposase
MSKRLVSDELWEVVVPLLPEEPPKPKGGRPRVDDRAALSGIKLRVARKGIESSEKLGRRRWVVERTLAWLAKYRRLTIRYEWRDDIHEAFLYLGCSLICLNYLT